MKILIIGTVNGIQNEGMRNVITQLSKSFEKTNEVFYASLKDFKSIARYSKKCDAVFLCARANKKTYILCKFIEVFCKHIYFVIVQRPQRDFLSFNNLLRTRCNFLTINRSDAENINLKKGCSIHNIKVGINTSKFKPLSKEERHDLKLKYGFEPNKTIVLHVGHCSSGRGLEDFCELDADKYQRIVVSSGLFEDSETIRNLNISGVKVLSGFLPNVEELYQLADVYLFPTKTTEFVISIPLSVMEALACGTPVIAYKQLETIKLINVVNADAIKTIGNSDELNMVVEKSVSFKTDVSLLKNCVSWDESAQEILKILERCIR